MVKTRNIFGKENNAQKFVEDIDSNNQRMMKILLVILSLMSSISIVSGILYLLEKIDAKFLFKIIGCGWGIVFVIGLIIIVIVKRIINEKRSWEITKQYLSK